MSHQEEQQLELEALASIFSDTYTNISPNSFSIKILPSSTELNHVHVNIEFTFPENYPDVAPNFKIIDSTKLSGEDLNEIARIINESAAQNLGNVMIFVIVSAVQEFLLPKNDALHSEYEEEQKRIAEEAKQRAAEEQLNKEQQKKAAATAKQQPQPQPTAQKAAAAKKPTNSNQEQDESELKRQQKKIKQQATKMLKKKQPSISANATTMKRADEIIARVKWDPQLSGFIESDDFIIVYLDRFTGLQETTITLFEEENLIPMHRIYYFKLNGKIVWDRKKRIDLVTSGEVYQYLNKENVDVNDESNKYENITEEDVESARAEEEAEAAAMEENEYELEAEDEYEDLNTTTGVPSILERTRQLLAQQQQESNQAEEEEIEDYVPEESTQQEQTVVFSHKKNRHIYKLYTPEDMLEKYMLSINDRQKAMDYPTHISQRGGQYFVHRKYREDFYHEWVNSIISGEKFYMEEFRTRIFRLYIDIDLKLTERRPYNIVEQEWLPQIYQYAKEYFFGEKPESVDLDITLIDCHDDWTDSTTVTAVYKSGYRVYFNSIFVDLDTLEDFVQGLSDTLKPLYNGYKGQPSDWKFTDVVDVASCKHSKVRMFGTSKFRRGNIIPRVYKLAGYFVKGELDEGITAKLKQKEHMIPLLKLLTARFDESETSASQDASHSKKILVTENKQNHRSLYSSDVTSALR